MGLVTVKADHIFFAVDTKAENVHQSIHICVDQYVDKIQFVNSFASSEVLVRKF
jgi:hypothetical protein